MWSSTQSTTSFGSTCIHRDGEFFGEACLPRSARASPPTHCTFRFTSPQRPIWEERTTNISTTIDLGFFTAVHANASAIAGALASVAHDAVMTPLDVLKQRMQLGLYPRPYVAFRSILKNEGFGALYASYFTTILMNIPNAAVLVVTNDWMKSILNPSGNQNFSAFLVSGLVAGALSGFVTCPLDVIKTRIQTQASDSTVVTRKYTGFWQTFKLMLKEEGVRSLFMGVSTRVMQQAPSAALSWTVYESVKRLLA